MFASIFLSRIQDKVKGIGFDWNNRSEVWDKVKEEIEELEHEVELGSNSIEEEFGDVLFSLINYARFININPDDALSKTNDKFISRFQLMEKLMLENSVNIESLNLAEMDIYWEKAKKIVKDKTKD